MTTYNIYPGAAPSLTANADSAVSLSTEFYVTSAGWVTEIRHLQPHGTVSTAARTCALYAGNGDNTGTLVAGPFTMPAPSGTDVWVTYTLATPYALTVNQRYRVVIYHPGGAYPAGGGYFETGHTDGILVGPAAANVVGNMQGAYEYGGSIAWPQNTFNSTTYYSDVTVTDVNPFGISISPSGIASAEAFGTAVVTTGSLTVSPSGIASAEAFGTAAVSVPVNVLPAGITSSEAFGSHFITKTLAVAPSGITSAEAFGSTSVNSTLAVSPNGVTSGEVFGAVDIVAQGGPTQTVTVTAGIAGQEAVGTPAVNSYLEVAPAGIPSGAALGTPGAVLGTLTVAPAGLSSPEAFGNATITQTTYTVTPAGIPSGMAFGLAAVSGALTGHRVALATLAPRRYQASIPPKEAARG